MSLAVDSKPDLSGVVHGDHEKLAHYYDKRLYDIVHSALNGTPIMALCGKKWIPSRDPMKFPVCPDCKDILDTLHPEG
jgi:hypothetical protein